jgi:hypothetical protein
MKKIQAIQLKNFGQLTTDNEEKETSNSSPTGYFLRPGQVKFIERTDKIKGKHGVKFGIEYFIKGTTDEKEEVVFACLINHPSMTNPKTKEQLTRIQERKINYTNQHNFDYFVFEYEWEIVKGQWVFEIKEDGQTLFTKEFEIV